MAIDQSEPGREPTEDQAEGRRTPSTVDEPADSDDLPDDDPADSDDLTDDDLPDGDEPAVPPSRASRLLREGWPYLAFTVAAVVLLQHLWRDPGGFMLLDNYQDQVFFEWLLTNGANSLAHVDNPLFSSKINAPYGLNLMANTSVLALALPLAPVTWLFGPEVTFAVIVTLALAGTAAGWYFVLNRWLRHRGAAVLGGAFCGFAPAMISQATGHPNIAGQYLLPFVVYASLRLGAPGRRPVVRGLILAALVILQAFVNEELLFLTALAMAVFLLVYSVTRWRDVLPRVPDALKSLATTALVAGAALAYPLYRQFFGTGNYRGLPDYILAYGADLAGYWSFARRSLAGNADLTAKLAQGATEENSFFGWPLLIAVLAIVVWLRRDAIVRALAVTGLVFAVMSLGSTPKRAGEPMDVPGPWGWLDGLPLFDSVVPTRLALVVTPIVGCMLAIAAVRYAERSASGTTEDKDKEAGVARLAGVVVLAMVLAPIAPTPLPVFGRPYVPPFFTTTMYRDHVPAGGVVLGVPPGWTPNLHAMQWQTAADLDFTIFGGYFLAPNPDDPDRVAMFGPVYPRTMTMLAQVAEQGAVIDVTPDVRAQAAEDFRTTGVTTLVMPAHHWRATELRIVVDALVGPGTLAGGMWVWDVRDLN